MPSDSHNSTMAKAMGLIFSLFNAASAREVPFAILLYMQCILHGLTTVTEIDGFHLLQKSSIVATSITKVLFKQLLICIYC